MLVVHPDSHCEMCTESYNSERAPHAITCGHVFCFDCLQKYTPSHCPMCGEVCGGEKIKKLFVETTITESDGTVWASQRSAIAEYLHMVAMVSGEEASEVEVENVRTRVNEWAASLPQNLRLQSQPVLLALASVKRGRKAQRDLDTARTECLATERKLARAMGDARRAKCVERALSQQIEILQMEHNALPTRMPPSPLRGRSNPRSREVTSVVGRDDNRDVEPREVLTSHTNGAATPELRRKGACMTCRQRKMKCDGTQPICSPCSKEGTECLQTPPRHADVGVGITQDPHQSPTARSRRERRNSKSKDGTVEKPRNQRRTRARPRGGGSRSGSISEGHQSPEDDVESKKKVDWYDAQPIPSLPGSATSYESRMALESVASSTKRLSIPPKTAGPDGAITGERRGGSPPRRRSLKTPILEQSPLPCTLFYLANCKSGSECQYGHNYVLNEYDYETIRINAKNNPCRAILDGGECSWGPKCVYGHICPDAPRCPLHTIRKCRFSGEGMHSVA